MQTPVPLRGPWRIVEMELWDRYFLDLVEPAHITLEDDGLGGFAFGAVQGWIDCRFSKVEGRHRLEFTWEGADEGDPTSGRGWAILVADDRLEGRLFFHRGDDSAFFAQRSPAPAKKRKYARR